MTDDEAVGRARPQRWQRFAGALGELLVSGGLVVLLFVVYEVYVTDWQAAQYQEELTAQLQEKWAADPVPADRRSADLGDGLAVLHIPRLGSDYRRVVLEGTQEAQLSRGPGHYPGTAMPGEAGNVAIA